ncbi:MAG TPA: hypothetical protein VMB91_03530 [Solirubrobacteraceae bacterium]|nr:hypothetical protein [Solirubrobacteraceae bacterium]
MLNGRIYRAAFVPFLLALGVAAFSLGARPGPLRSNLAPDAFQGSSAMARLNDLARAFPSRRPGGPSDQLLARMVAQNIEALGGTAGGGFAVHTYSFGAQTIEGERTLTNVVAVRPGSTSATPIVIVAHRDAARGPAKAELSATAALLELARVFASRDTQRTIVLASTSGGSGGDAGVARLRSELPDSMDAAIVLGDLGGTVVRRPMVVPYSDGEGSAPLVLARTVEDAIKDQAVIEPGAPSALGQLVHLMVPLSVGEQGVLDREGVPAVLVGVSGERGPSRNEPVNGERLETMGRSVLSAVDALDAAPDVTQARQNGIVLQRQQMPQWAVRLLVLMLIVPVLVTAVDGLARVRRWGLQPARWATWTLSCAVPFALTALLTRLLGLSGLLGPVPGGPVLPAGLGFGGGAAAGLLLLVACFAMSWFGWGAVTRRAGWGTRPDPEVGGLSTVLVAVVLSVVVWVVNPYTALLLVPALHVWLLLAAPELRPRRVAGWIGLVLLAAAPVAIVTVFYAHELGLGVGELLWAGVLLLAGGFVGPAGAILWSVGLGCGVSTLLLALVNDVPVGPEQTLEPLDVTIRGPLSYAGPGSLGGTESALRR